MRISCLAVSIALTAAFAGDPAAAQGKFEVLSIKPMGADGGIYSGPTGNTNPSPNGFDSRLSIWQMINVAYGPANSLYWGSVEIRNAPEWVGQFYDIKARVSPADLKTWQSQGKEHEFLRSAMRAALKDRCKLAIHEQPAQGEIFELVIGKRGSQLKQAQPHSSAPAGGKLPSGGILVQTVENGAQVKTYYGATMQDLADFLCIMSGKIPVRDKTGLTGHYDFRIRQVPPLPDENHVYSYPVDHLGLQVKPGTESRPIWVIDHIEKPSAN